MKKQNPKLNFSHFSDCRGMTLIEVLLAIALLSFLMVMVITIMNNSIDNKDRIITEDRDFLQLETALSRFETDFIHLYSPLFYSRQYNPKTDPYNYGKEPDKIFDANRPFQRHQRYKAVSVEGHYIPIYKNNDKSSFAFMTTSNRRKVENSKDSIYAWVEYKLERMEKTDFPEDSLLKDEELYRFVRVFQATDPYEDNSELTTGKGFVLVDHIKSLAFQFWDPKDKKFEESLKEVNGGENFVKAVKIIINQLDANKVERIVERIFYPLWPEFTPEKLEDLYKTKKDREEDLIEDTKKE
jgi:prepilin-type N-terminal cleavage/methylation domain-containing protein